MSGMPMDGAALLRLMDPRTALAAWRLWTQAAETGIHAAMTIQARLAMIGTAMATGRDFPVTESWQMVAEKQQAMMESAAAAWRANPAFASDPRALLRTATAGLRPYRRKTRSNARRLA
jgi:hypothetical protein